MTCPPELTAACELAHDASLAALGYRNACVPASMALAAYLRDSGHAGARTVRIVIQTVLSSGFPWYVLGAELEPSPPGTWGGHLAVTCDGWLLDPTADQIERIPGPLALSVPDEWSPWLPAVHVTPDGVQVACYRCAQQDAPDDDDWRAVCRRMSLSLAGAI